MPEPARAPIGLLEYALRSGTLASVNLLLEAGSRRQSRQFPRPLTVLTMAQALPRCRPDRKAGRVAAGRGPGRLCRDDRARPADTADRAGAIQGLGHPALLDRAGMTAAGGSAHTNNDDELRVIARLLAELRAIDGIMQRACRRRSRKRPRRRHRAGHPGLVAAVLRSEDPAALWPDAHASKKELRLPLDFDATATLLELSARIADHPVPPPQAAFVRLLLEAGAEMQRPEGGDSPFERALGCENHVSSSRSSSRPVPSRISLQPPTWWPR